MRKKEPTTYKNFTVIQMSDGKWLAEVDILTPKKYKLQYAHDEQSVAKDRIQQYLKSQDATEEKE